MRGRRLRMFIARAASSAANAPTSHAQPTPLPRANAPGGVPVAGSALQGSFAALPMGARRDDRAHALLPRPPSPLLLSYQRPYQRRPPPSATPPTKKPSSQSITAMMSTYHSTWAAKPKPPNSASISTSAISATTLLTSVSLFDLLRKLYPCAPKCNLRRTARQMTTRSIPSHTFARAWKSPQPAT
jgi:hypothetical protein